MLQSVGASCDLCLLQHGKEANHVVSWYTTEPQSWKTVGCLQVKLYGTICYKQGSKGFVSIEQGTS